ncbi:MAG: hypothetical protein ACLVEJ_10315 [Parabacteroides sp.]
MSLVIGYRYLIAFPLDEQLTGNILLEFLFLSVGCLFLYMLGVEDDLIGVRYRKKFITQFLVASLLPLQVSIWIICMDYSACISCRYIWQYR